MDDLFSELPLDFSRGSVGGAPAGLEALGTVDGRRFGRGGGHDHAPGLGFRSVGSGHCRWPGGWACLDHPSGGLRFDALG